MFRTPKDITDVRDAVEKTGLKDVAVSNVIDADHPGTGGKYKVSLSTPPSRTRTRSGRICGRHSAMRWSPTRWRWRRWGPSRRPPRGPRRRRNRLRSRRQKTPVRPPAEKPAKPPADLPGKHAKARSQLTLARHLPPDSLLAAAGPEAASPGRPEAFHRGDGERKTRRRISQNRRPRVRRPQRPSPSRLSAGPRLS